MRASLCGTAVFIGLSALAAGCGNNTGAPASTGGAVTQAENEEFCQADPATAAIRSGSRIEVCGVGMPDPTVDLVRSTNTMEFAGSGPPQVGCFSPTDPTYPKAAAAPKMATIKGVAKIFANGSNSSNLQIQFYTVDRSGDASDGMPGMPIGPGVTTVSDCSVPGAGVTSMVTMSGNSTARYECYYTYPNVPTNTEIMVKTQGAFWAPLYEYNDYIPDAEVDAMGNWAHDVRALAADDYSNISQVALGHGITPGNGALAGEVHDCGNVRLENAVVDVDAKRKLLTYFTSDEANPLPDLSATSTSSLGLYSALDVPTGPITVAAVGQLGGKDVTLGFFKAQIFANSVTAVTFQGLRPFQLPK